MAQRAKSTWKKTKQYLANSAANKANPDYIPKEIKSRVKNRKLSAEMRLAFENEIKDAERRVMMLNEGKRTLPKVNQSALRIEKKNPSKSVYDIIGLNTSVLPVSYTKLTDGNNIIFTGMEDIREKFEDYVKWAESNPIQVDKFIHSGAQAGAKTVDISRPILLESFLARIGMTPSQWKKMRKNDLFKDDCEYIENRINSGLIEGGMVGSLDPVMVSKLIPKIEDEIETPSSIIPIQINLGNLKSDNNLIE